MISASVVGRIVQSHADRLDALRGAREREVLGHTFSDAPAAEAIQLSLEETVRILDGGLGIERIVAEHLRRLLFELDRGKSGILARRQERDGGGDDHAKSDAREQQIPLPVKRGVQLLEPGRLGRLALDGHHLQACKLMRRGGDEIIHNALLEGELVLRQCPPDVE